MKTAKEILEKRKPDITHTVETFSGKRPFNYSYYEENVLDLMEEYAAQWKDIVDAAQLEISGRVNSSNLSSIENYIIRIAELEAENTLLKKQPSPEESAIKLEAWKKVMSSANEAMVMFEKKPTRAELLKEIEELKAKTEQPITPMLIDFDLEIALKHPERVRTRDGRTVGEIKLFETYINEGYELAVIIATDLYWYHRIGVPQLPNQDMKLFLIAETKTMWVNVYELTNGVIALGTKLLYETEKEARRFKANAIGNYIATRSIQIPIK